MQKLRNFQYYHKILSNDRCPGMCNLFSLSVGPYWAHAHVGLYTLYSVGFGVACSDGNRQCEGLCI